MPFWTCPDCGNRKVGPKRPRRNATVRICLVCSEKTGHLVERQCLSQIAQTEARRTARKQKAVDQQVRAFAKRVERCTLNGVDLTAELARVWALPAAVARREAHDRPRVPPVLKVRRPDSVTKWRGFAGYGDHVLHITAGALVPRSRILEILVHEVAHFCTSVTAGHDAGFTQTQNEILHEAFPGITGLPIRGDATCPTKEYARGEIVHEALRRVLNDAASGSGSGS